MKKTLQILFFSALSVTGMAQHKANLKQTEGPRAIQKNELGAKPATRTQSVSYGNRDLLFHETFENDFLGTTPYGEWTYSHSLTGVPSTQGSMWSIGGPSYENVYGGAGDALDSDTPSKWALWDGAAYYDEYPSSGSAEGAFYSAYLNAPAMDFSEQSSVMISFQQVFRYCCFPTSPISVDVSSDNGATWTSFNAIGTAVEGANIQSADPLYTVIDITCAAAGQSNVLIRFAYNSAEEAGYTHYYWGIDEVKIFENEYASDLFISELVNGDIINDWEFRVTPQEQIRGAADGGLILGVRAGNKGYEDEPNATVLFELLDEDGNVAYQYTSPEFNLYAPGNDTVCPHVGSSWFIWETGIEVTTLGTYSLRATINGSGEEADTVSTDNILAESIVFNNIGEYGHDGDSSSDFQYQIGCRYVSGNSGPRDQGGWGSHYSFINPGSTAHGVTVRFGSNTVAGVPFKAALIAQDNTQANLDNSPTVASGDYETTQSWLAGNANEPLFFAFNDPFNSSQAQGWDVEVISENNLNYVAAIWRQTSGLGNITVLAQNTLDADLSSVAWEKGGDQSFHWFHFQEFNYAVRLVLSAPYVNHIPVGVEEVENLASFSVYPNPAVDEARVTFNLPESCFIAYEVRDLQGRLMDTANIGRFGAGQNSFALNVSNYAAGNYIVGLVVDGKQIISQQISVVR